MSGLTTTAAPTIAPAWIEPVAPRSVTPKKMTVKVRTASGEKSYEGLFATSFDAYSDALDRFGEAVLRIEVSRAGQGAR